MGPRNEYHQTKQEALTNLCKSKPKQIPKAQPTTRIFQPPSKPSRFTQPLLLFCTKDIPIRRYTTHLGNTLPSQLFSSTPIKMSGSVRLINIYSLNVRGLCPTLFLKSALQQWQEENAKCQKFHFLAKSPIHQRLAESRPSIERRLRAPTNEASTVNIAAEPANASFGRF